jgi:hypothetical protein
MYLNQEGSSISVKLNYEDAMHSTSIEYINSVQTQN